MAKTNHYRRMRKLASLSSLTLLFLATSLLFQNCSQPISFQNMVPLNLAGDGAAMESGGGTGSGGTYDGKPTYLRFVPNFSCDGREVAKAEIQLSSTSAQITERLTGLCQQTQNGLRLDQLDISVLQSEFLGYQGAIFKRYETVPAGIPDSLVEVSCRDKNASDGVEVVTHYDPIAKRGLARLYVGSAGGVALVPDFNVSRVLTASSISYGAENFSLSVNFFAPSDEAYRFRGLLETTVGGVRSTKEVHCLLGGQLDSSVWPGQEVLQKATSVAALTWANQDWLIATDDLVTDTISTLNFETRHLTVMPYTAAFGRPVNNLPDGSLWTRFRAGSEQRFLVGNPFAMSTIKPTPERPGLDWSRAPFGVGIWRPSQSSSNFWQLTFRAQDEGLSGSKIGFNGWILFVDYPVSQDTRLFVNKPNGFVEFSVSRLLAPDRSLCATAYMFSTDELVTLPCPRSNESSNEVEVRDSSGSLKRSFRVSMMSGRALALDALPKTFGHVLALRTVRSGQSSVPYLLSPETDSWLLVRLTDGATITLREGEALTSLSADMSVALTKMAADGSRSLWTMDGSVRQGLPGEVIAAEIDPTGSEVYSLRSDGELWSLNPTSKLERRICTEAGQIAALIPQSGAGMAQSPALLVVGSRNPGVTEIFNLNNGNCTWRNSLPMSLTGQMQAHSDATAPELVLSVARSVSSWQRNTLVFVVPMDGRPARWLNPGGVNFKDVRLLKVLPKHDRILIQSREDQRQNSLTFDKYLLFQL